MICRVIEICRMTKAEWLSKLCNVPSGVNRLKMSQNTMQGGGAEFWLQFIIKQVNLSALPLGSALFIGHTLSEIVDREDWEIQKE